LPIENIVEPDPKASTQPIKQGQGQTATKFKLENQILKIQIEAEVTALVQDVQIKIMIDDLIHSQFI
jgi:hypothetical protein